MVFSSSATVYGQPEKIPCVEDFELVALNPYGRTKVLFHLHMLMFLFMTLGDCLMENKFLHCWEFSDWKCVPSLHVFNSFSWKRLLETFKKQSPVGESSC